MSDELESCPCGGQVYVGELRFTGETQWCVGCLQCNRDSGKHTDKASAIAAWNRRASPTTEGARNEAIEAAKRIVETVAEADAMTVARYLLSCPLIKNVRREALEEAAKVADEAQATAREEIAEEKAEEGYDPYAFGSGFLSGELTAAVNIAKAIRALKEKNNG